MRISDWSSDVCSSDLLSVDAGQQRLRWRPRAATCGRQGRRDAAAALRRHLRSRDARAGPLYKPRWWAKLGAARRGLKRGRKRGSARVPHERLDGLRSEETRVGKECVSSCRSRWSQYTETKKKTKKT